ncbi:hypothetical protein TIFTF001_037120, partial [Ficus carica]
MEKRCLVEYFTPVTNGCDRSPVAEREKDRSVILPAEQTGSTRQATGSSPSHFLIFGLKTSAQRERIEGSDSPFSQTKRERERDTAPLRPPTTGRRMERDRT